ncbi:MAG: hypothetical protein IKX63_00750 [Muribaculaceae bacterium]|nr:hypothetical protein [Muribaculaceae bacterium]
MNKLAGFLWLALLVSLLGWYGWAMVAIGAVLVFVGTLLYNLYLERKSEKQDKKL